MRQFHSRWWSLAKETGAVRLEVFSHWRRMTGWGSFTQSLPFSWLCLCLENQVKRSVQLPPVGAAILMLPGFCTTFRSGMSLRPAYARAIFHSNCLFHWDPNRANSYLLIQKLSSDNRWLQYGPTSKPIHPWYPMSKIPQVNIITFFFLMKRLGKLNSNISFCATVFKVLLYWVNA